MTAETPALDYSKTVNLPQTGFPQKANLPEREPQILAKWEEMGLAALAEKQRFGRPLFVLHDGPPYANADIHIGHSMNKTLKDIVVRYKTMKGFLSSYVPGWDCHGLPIEQKALEELKKRPEHERKDPVVIRKTCQDYANKWIGIQREQFKRIGIGGRWEDPYTTMSPRCEVAILRALSDLVRKGLVYRGFKPVHWDWVYETALAEAEIEYNEKHVSPSIHVRFPVTGAMPAALAGLGANVNLVIWTTTPWTLPANLGVCAHAEFEYVALRRAGETLLVAKGLLEQFRKETGVADGEVVAEFRGAILEHLELAHPIFDKTVKVMLGEHVTLEAGTGLVHTAPAHGVDDFEVGKRYGIGVFNPVDERGRYTDLFPEMKGVNVIEANPKVIEKLKDSGRLLHESKVTHKYPYSWRSHKPVIQRATEQWFMAVDKDGLRARTMEELKRVQWIPTWGIDRIHNMIESRPDWCLSRQRAWGVPIPSLYDTVEKKSVLDADVVERFAEFVATEGTDCWFTRPVSDFVPSHWNAPAGRYEKEQSVLDVWFDSGCTHLGVLEGRENLHWPADLYLEGADQHRGWFQSSLLVAMGVRGRAPYRAILTHGFVLDDKGQAMSKSLGNVISPLEVIKQSGADVLRLWVASEDYRGDVSISKNALEQVAGAYRRIRNTIRFLLGNLFDFDPALHAQPLEKMEEDDRFALAALAELIARVGHAYETYEFHRVYHLVNGFCVVELGSQYLDGIKDRMYCSAPDDRVRRASQTVAHELASALLRLIAPICPFTADEGWGHLPGATNRLASIHLADFPVAHETWRAPELVAKWERLLALRGEVLKAIEPLRAKENKVIGNSLDARVTLTTDDGATLEFLRAEAGHLARLFIVSVVEIREGQPTCVAGELAAHALRLSVAVDRAPGTKCERCWMYTDDAGASAAHPTLCGRCADALGRTRT